MEHTLIGTIEFQMSLLLFVALAGYLFAIRINQSAIIGEILLGILIGPSLLGLITYSDFVHNVAHLGAIILLFVVGLEFKLKDVFQWRYGLIALIGVIVPWIGGYFITQAFGYDFQSAIFTGTALTATSIAITANVLKEMGKLQTEAAKAIIGAAVMDDVISLLALSISKQVVGGGLTVEGVLVPSVTAVAFVFFGLWIGHRWISRLVEQVDRWPICLKYPEFTFIFVMSVAFLYAMAAEVCHVSGIVGAFMAGISLEGVKLKHSKSFKEGAEYLHAIFAAVFFVSLGILVNLRLLSPEAIVFMFALTAVAVLTKVAGCFIPARFLGLSTRDAAVVGFGMSPRGEVAMIVGLIGLQAKLITQEIYAAVIFMSLFTTLLTPIVLKNWLYKR